jgi:hypothetical protein
MTSRIQSFRSDQQKWACIILRVFQGTIRFTFLEGVDED